MNYQEENPLGQQPKSADEITEDRELKSLLAEWKSPEPTDYLDQSVYTAYRRQFRHRPWWRRWLTGSVRIPVPVVTVGLLLCATAYLAVRMATSNSIEISPTSTPVKFIEVPVPVVQERVITRVVYAKAGPQKIKGGTSPESFSVPSDKKTIERADLASFRPVSEIRIVVSREGEER